MQQPFWKCSGEIRSNLERDFLRIVECCKIIGINLIVVPLVDNGSLKNKKQEDYLVSFLKDHINYFHDQEVQVTFESDFDPIALAKFISRLDPEIFGINFDTGNSAALGFYPTEELNAYGTRVLNVHIKDRLYKGTTVPLNEGNVDFDLVFKGLKNISYKGNLVLQTARATDQDHASALVRYGNMTNRWIRDYDL